MRLPELSRLRRRLLSPVTLIAAAAVFSGCGSSPIAPPPALTMVCPAAVTTQASQGQTTVTIIYPAPVVSGGKAPVTTSCAPASGASFDVGTTTVSCTASDAATQFAACSIPVTVDPPPVPRLSATSFMAFGDSLTEGKISLTGFQNVTFPTSYTNKLVAMLQSRYSAQTIVLTAEGAGGNKAVDDVDRFDRALDADKPQVVLLMEGANDLNERGDGAVDPVIHALDTMAFHAMARGIQVFLATLPPENPAGPKGAGAGSVPSLNVKIVNLAASRQLVLVDVSAAFRGDLSLIGADGLHPTDAGYQVIAQAFYDRIVASFELPPTSSYLGRDTKAYLTNRDAADRRPRTSGRE